MPQFMEQTPGQSSSATPGLHLVGVDREHILGTEPRPVRHDVARETDEIVVLRYFKIKKGSFSTFLAASRDGLWPYFEKIGTRTLGMWQVIHPSALDASGAREAVDYDEVYLMTRYASVEHWAATRDFTRLGGNGPDAEKAYAAHLTREALTLETSFVFLQGHLSTNGPYFLPSVAESYRLIADASTFS